MTVTRPMRAILVGSSSTESDHCLQVYVPTSSGFRLVNERPADKVLALLGGAPGTTVYAATSDSDHQSTVLVLDYSSLGLELRQTFPLTGHLVCALERFSSSLVSCCYLDSIVECHEITQDGRLAAGGVIRLDADFSTRASRPSERDHIDRQDRSHPHGATWSPALNSLLVCDLGSDLLLRFVKVGGGLVLAGATELEAGSGPRNAVALPDGRVIVVGELNSTLMELTLVRGHLIRTATVSTTSMPPRSAYADNYAGAMLLLPDGDLLVANRGAGTLARFDTRQRGLQVVAEIACGGEWPVDLALWGDNVLVANELSGSVAVFATGVSPHSLSTLCVRGPSAVLGI